MEREELFFTCLTRNRFSSFAGCWAESVIFLPRAIWASLRAGTLTAVSMQIANCCCKQTAIRQKQGRWMEARGFWLLLIIKQNTFPLELIKRAGFWHAEAGEDVLFLLYWIGERNDNTGNNNGHVERDKKTPFLQFWLTCSALAICRRLASGLHEVKYFPWSSFLFGHMEWDFNILQRSSWCFQIWRHKSNPKYS